MAKHFINRKNALALAAVPAATAMLVMMDRSTRTPSLARVLLQLVF